MLCWLHEVVHLDLDKIPDRKISVVLTIGIVSAIVTEKLFPTLV
jgi:hypothetical protein